MNADTALVANLMVAFPGAELAQPYPEMAAKYAALDYSPIPVEEKFPPLGGYTGWRGRWVDLDEAERLARTHAGWNIALRLPEDAVGIDIDAYAGGLVTLAALGDELGPLPKTIMSTARDDGSGIRLFRKPVGWHLAGSMGAGIDVIQNHHRYVMANPSIHPTEDRPYRWIDEASGDEIGPVHVGDLPDLPWAWLEKFRKYGEAGADPVTSERARAFISAHIDETFPAALDGVRSKLDSTPGGRHDSLITGACWSLREAAAGRFTAEDAIRMLHDWWVAAIGGDAKRLDGDEFGSAVLWAIGQVEAQPERVEEIRAKDEANRRKHEEERNTRVDDFVAGAGANRSHSDTGAPRLPTTFWDARPVFAHIRQAAHSRLIAPDAMFGCVLVRVAALTHHRLHLPATVARDTGLDLFGIVTAPPGHGKGAAVDGAAKLVPVTDFDTGPDVGRQGRFVEATAGSGEGIVKLCFATFEEKSDDGKKTFKVQRQAAWNVLIRIDEGEVLGRLGNRRESTTLQTLRAAWSGERLGASYSDDEKDRHVTEYRLCVVMALQPTVARFLLADVDAGTPQRFTWFTATDPDIPDDPPAWPGPVAWHPPHVDRSNDALDIAPEVAAEVRTAHLARARGHVQEDPLEAHANLRRLKVAGVLAVLDRRLHSPSRTGRWQASSRQHPLRSATPPAEPSPPRTTSKPNVKHAGPGVYAVRSSKPKTSTATASSSTRHGPSPDDADATTARSADAICSKPSSATIAATTAKQASTSQPDGAGLSPTATADGSPAPTPTRAGADGWGNGGSGGSPRDPPGSRTRRGLVSFIHLCRSEHSPGWEGSRVAFTVSPFPPSPTFPQ